MKTIERINSDQINKLIKKPKKLVQVLRGGVELGVHRFPSIKTYEEMFRSKRKSDAWKDGLANFLEDLVDRGLDPFFENNGPAMIRVFDHGRNWVRSIHDWKKKTHNKKRALVSLIRHLFVLYQMPSFMDEAWFENNEMHVRWYMTLGTGKSVRDIKEFPVKFTKKMAHIFMNHPDEGHWSNISVTDAIYWAYVHGIGGDEHMANAVFVSNRLDHNFSNFDFWSTVIEYFVRNPLLDRFQFPHVCDYIHYVKFQRRIVGGLNGTRAEPEHPNFSMKGRNPETLMNSVEEWDRNIQGQMRKGRRQEVRHWERAPIGGITLVFGKKEKAKTWQITQLTSSAELRSEGRALKHCIASYARSCAEGRTIVFSMTLREKSNFKNMLTIAVDKDKTISEIRGRANRYPTRQEMDIVRHWAAEQKLGMSNWLMAI